MFGLLKTVLLSKDVLISFYLFRLHCLSTENKNILYRIPKNFTSDNKRLLKSHLEIKIKSLFPGHNKEKKPTSCTFLDETRQRFLLQNFVYH